MTGRLDAWARRARWELFAATVAAAVAGVPAIAHKPLLDYDSTTYLARPSLTGERLPVVPALYWLCGHHLRAIVVMQVLIGVGSWSYLAFEARRSTRSPWSGLALVSVLVLSCSDYVAHWYGAVLSDSLSLSFFALFAAVLSAWLARRRHGAWVVAALCLWTLTRATSAYVVVVVGIVGVVVAVVRRSGQWRAFLVVLMAGAASTASSDAGRLWVQPFLHVLTERILVSPQRSAWFVRHGMPLTPQLQRQAGPDVPSVDQTLRDAPGLAGFRAWMNRVGERTYLEYALTHPGFVLRGTFGRHEELSEKVLDFYGGRIARPWYPWPLRLLFMAHRQATLVVLGALTDAAVVARRCSLDRRVVAWWGLVVVTGVAGLAVDWTGDSWELGRHSVGATVQVATGLLMLLVAASARPSGGLARQEVVQVMSEAG